MLAHLADERSDVVVRMHVPILYSVFQSAARANGGLESITQILRRVSAPRMVLTQRESRFTETWRSMGCEVRIVASPETEVGTRWVELKSRLARTPSLVRFNAVVGGLVRERGIPLVHCNDITALWHAAPGARASGAKVLFNVRDMFESGRAYGPRWRAAHHLADEIVCLSEEMKADVLARFPPLASRGAADVSVIHSTVDLERMRPLEPASRAALRAELGVRPDAFEIVNIGTFCPKKNQLDFIREALPALMRRLPETHVTFVGDFEPDSDPYARACLEAVSTLGLAERVRFVGFVDCSERWMQAADIVCVTSRYEGLPRAMIESLACGTPVVAFDVTSAREFLEGHDCGIVVVRYDWPGLGEAIASLAGDASLRSAMSRRARNVALQKFDGEVTTGSYLVRYEALLAA